MKVQSAKKSQFRATIQTRASPSNRPSSPKHTIDLAGYGESNIIDSAEHSARQHLTLPASLPPRSSQPFTTTFFETPSLLQLPTELLTKLTTHLPFPSYIALAMTCKTLYSRLFSHEIIFYLKNRFNLNAQSGSMIVFAYQTGLITKAPRVCEAILDEFFNGRAGDEAGKSGASSALSPASTSAISTRKEQFKTVRFWAVLYAIHRAIPVYFDTMLGSADPNGGPFPHATSQPQANQNTPAIPTQTSASCFSAEPALDTTSQRTRTPTPYFGSETQHFKPPTSGQNLAFLEKYVSYMHDASDDFIPHKSVVSTAESPPSSSESPDTGTDGVGLLSPSVTLPTIYTCKTYHTIFLHVLKSGDLDILEFYLRTYGPPFCNFRLRGDEYDDLEGLDLGGGPMDNNGGYVNNNGHHGVGGTTLATQHQTYGQHHQQNGVLAPLVPASAAAAWVFGNGGTNSSNASASGNGYGNTGKELRRKVKQLLERYGVTVSDGIM